MNKTIYVLVNDGSPIGVTSKTVYGDSFRVGVGGAELALLTLCEEWTKRGDNVVLFNNPHEKNASTFEQRNIVDFNVHDKPDILIVFRSPNIKAIPSEAKKKIWWSCDQNTVGDYKKFGGFIDSIVVISPYHKNYFEKHYGITNTTVIDLPVRIYEYEQKVERKKHQFLFSSVPDRGLDALYRMWPLIRKEIPDAILKITSDYRLWGSRGAGNERHRMKWASHSDFKFLGAIPRKQLIQEQLSSDALVYPSSYEELFCITVAEAQVAGAIPFTSNIGALETTNMSCVFDWNVQDSRGDKMFVDKLVEWMYDPNLEEFRSKLMERARNRFSPQRVLGLWDVVFEA